jgi:hypothetical protein
MRWTRRLRTTNANARGRRSRVVLAPRCWRQVRERRFPRLASDGGKRAGHQGELEISRNTIAQGRPDASAEPVCSCALSFCFLHTGPRVQRAPGLPCALFIYGAPKSWQTSGTSCRENADSHPHAVWEDMNPIFPASLRGATATTCRGACHRAALRADRWFAMTVDGLVPYFTTPISRKYFSTPGWMRSTFGAAATVFAAVVSQACASFSQNFASTPCSVRARW